MKDLMLIEARISMPLSISRRFVLIDADYQRD